MKHLLNNISEEEKNSIREQHSGGMKLMNEKFQQMVNKKLGQVNLYEQTDEPEVPKDPLLNRRTDYAVSNGFKLPVIKSEKDLQKFLVLSRADLLYTSLTGFQSPDPKIEAKALNIFQELLKSIARTCDNDVTCAKTVEYSNLVDNFFTNMKNRNDNIENSKELSIYPKNSTMLKRFKSDLARNIKSKIEVLRRQQA